MAEVTEHQFRRGTSAEHSSFIGAEAEVTFDTTLKLLRIHDGVTTGGRKTILEGLAIGATTANTGAFTTLTSTGSQTFSGSNTLITSANTKFTGNVVFGSNGAVHLPMGTTAERGSWGTGSFRYNVTIGKPEIKVAGTWSNVLTTAVSNSEIIDLSVGPAEIASGALIARHFAASSVGNTAIADGTVGSAEIAVGAVTSAKIVDGAVTSDKIDGTVVANTYLQTTLGSHTSNTYASNTFTSYDTIVIEAPAADTEYDFLRKLPRNQDYRTIYYSTQFGSANVGFWVGSDLVANISVSSTANNNSISVTGKTGDRVYIHLYDSAISTTANLEFSFGG